jgi:hypothetical protein
MHAAKLVDIEWLTVESDTGLFVNDRTTVFPFDGNIAIKEEWREDNQTDGSQQAVDQPFHLVV